MLGLALIGMTQLFPSQAKAATTVSQLVTSNGKTYLQVDGKPWFDVGIQNDSWGYKWIRNTYANELVEKYI